MGMDKIKDKTFGEVEINHGWQRRQVIQFWNRPIDFKIKAAQYSNSEITDVQRNNYQFVLNNIDLISSRSREAVKEYAKKIGQGEAEITPKTLIFFADGKFGILFDCEWDTEHGLAVSLPDYTVGPQDILL
jgi:hypothetical protein